jgi:hypothetical protein
MNEKNCVKSSSQVHDTEVAKLQRTREEIKLSYWRSDALTEETIHRIVIRPRSDSDSSDSAGNASRSEADDCELPFCLLVPPSFAT